MDGIITFCAQYLIIGVALVYAYIFFKLPANQRKQFIAVTLLALIIAAILDKLAGKVYYDPRPFVSHNVRPLFPHGADNGFPSDHTLFSTTIAAVLYFYRKKFAAIAFVLAVVIGSARVAAHVHSPNDIIGGLVLGAIAGWIGYYLGIRFVPARKSKDA